jgi:glucosamine-6-phosphate deaminase
MPDSVIGARRDAVAEQEARDRSTTRGPSRVVHVPPGLERIRTIVVDDHEHIARLVANRIATLIREREAAGENAVLCLATGSTPIGVYRELIRMHREEELSFAHVVTFNLDEYYPMAKDSIHSYHRFMWENLFSQIDIRPENVHIPDGTMPRDRIDEFCRRYEDEIERAGGIDFQILGIGKTGHIGFNEPGSGAESRTRPVLLDTITRRDAAADFFGEEYVPREAITRSPFLPRASTKRASCSAPSKARSMWRSPRRSFSGIRTPRSTSIGQRARSSRALRRRGSSTRSSGRRTSWSAR